PQVETLLGYAREEWLRDAGMALRLVHPDDRPAFESAWRDALRRGAPFHAECRMLARDGGVRWLRHEAVPVDDPEEQRPYLQGIWLDLTEEVTQRERREALLRVERRLATEPSAERVLLGLLEEVQRLLGIEIGSVYRWDEGQQTLVLVQTTLPDALARDVVLVRPGDGASGVAIRDRKPTIVND